MSTLFRKLAGRDSQAFGEICRRLQQRLMATAKKRVRREPELWPIYDEEDALNSSLNLMWLHLIKGKVNPPDGVDEFLRVARLIIRRRITAKLRELRAAKRSPSVKDETDTAETTELRGPYPPDDMNLWPSGISRPEDRIILEDLTDWFLSNLSLELQDIALYRIEGYTVEEIAKKRKMSPSSIERRLKLIRDIWSIKINQT